MKKTLIFLWLLCIFASKPVYSQMVSTLVTGPSTFDDCVTLDQDGNMYVSRYNGSTITKITPPGVTSIFASGFNTPNGTAFGPDGYLYVPSNILNGRIDRVSTSGVIDTFITSIPYPTTVFFESDTSMLITSYQLNKVYRANINGNYTTLYSGNGMNGPVDIEYDTDGNLLIADFTDGKIFRVDKNGTFSLLADLPGNLGFMVVANGYIYSTGFTVNKIFRTSMSGDTVTFAGSGVSGQINGPALTSRFNGPNGIAASSSGDTLYISDYGTRSLRVITGVSTGLININSSVPANLELKQNYPNPFNPETNIEFTIHEKSAVKLIIYDVMGNEIQHLVNENLSAGTYISKFNAGNLSSGTYFLRLLSGGLVQSKKMILLK